MKDLEIVYSDKNIAVCIKPKGMLSQSDGQEDAVKVLAEKEKCRIFPVHRLDRNTGGIMVFAKNEKSAKNLCEQVQDKDRFLKEYIAVVEGECDSCGVMQDFLYKSARESKAYIVKKERKGVKHAELSYEMIETSETEKGMYSLVKILLKTGRFHQIRAQFASRKLPLAGDGKYGGRDNACDTALWACRIKFAHPKTGERLEFSAPPPKEYPFDIFESNKNS